MARRETIWSLRVYFILSGLVSLLVSAFALREGLQRPVAIAVIIEVISIGFSLAFLYVGFSLAGLLRGSASRIVTLLYASTGWTVSVYLLRFLQGPTPVGLVTLYLVLLVLWFLLKNVRRLAAEAQGVTSEAAPSVNALTKATWIAAGLFILDAFIFNQGVVALCLIFVAVFIFLPRALWVRRRDRHFYEQRLAKAGIYLLTAMAVLGCNALQNRTADRRAIKIGNACLAFHAKYQRYPRDLEELVPAFLPSVPVAKCAMLGHFVYISPPGGGEPELYYYAIPPLGRRFYHLETEAWGYLD